jgi:phage terminase large subunit
MKLTKTQKRVARSNHRFKVVIAGRRWGKTYLAIREMCYRARYPGREIFYITSSYRAAKMIVWKPLKKRLLDLNWVKKINESELSITLKNDSVIALKGAENPDSLRGPSLSYVVIDEVADVDQNLWTEVLRPALSDQQGGALFIGTPKGKDNWSYDLYCRETFDPQTWKSFQFTTLEGGLVPVEEIEQARHDMTERQFNQEFNATFETYQNQVAWEFDRDDHVVSFESLIAEFGDNNKIPKHLPTHRLHVGMDFNVSPATAVIMTEFAGITYAFDEIMVYSSNTNEVADEIKRRYPNSEVVVYPDPSGNQRRSSANGQTDHIILKNAGFQVKAPRKHDPVRDRINATNARLRSADGSKRLYISPECKNTIESLEKYSFKEGTQIPEKNGWDHMFDALSYAIAYMYPIRIRKSTEDRTPNRWGHAIQA